MSKSKDGTWNPGGRRMWRDVSGHRRCPVCGADSWCQYHAFDPVALCKRVESRHRRINVEGVEFFIHQLGPDTFKPEPEAAIAPDVATAAPEVLNIAYRAILQSLDLSREHWDALRARGLSDHHIAGNEYRTLPVEGRAKLGKALLAVLGHSAAGVPGYHVARDDGREWPSFAGSAGIVVPVRDVSRRIVALKIRRDGDGDGPRYTYVSSARKGGASAVTAVHVPHWNGPTETVRVTEGELKADVCTVLGSHLTVSVPGVGLWRGALPVLHTLGARRVRVAFDADCRVNPRVADALRGLCMALRQSGFAVKVEEWNPHEGKGADDVLVNRRKVA